MQAIANGKEAPALAITQRQALPVYPFAAIVGQAELKQALLLCVIDPTIGGVMVMGHRGTAKSTAVRALAALMPPMKVVADCPYNCDPAAPSPLCPHCADLTRHPRPTPKANNGHAPLVTRQASTMRSVPVVDLPLGATEDRVVGALDIERALVEGVQAFAPGLLARANRGFLYIDEVNLLEDHLVDLLLDVAQSGVNVVEREGVSVRHPARFVLVGSGNPEEGDLRPQLLDRFALSVEIHGIREPRERVMIMERNLAVELNPDGFRNEWQPKENDLSVQIDAARKIVDRVTYTRRDLLYIASLTSSLNVDGHRADLVILRGAQAHAALQGRDQVTDEDIVLAAELALPHRIRGRMFQDTSLAAGDLSERLEEVQSEMGVSDMGEREEETQETAPTGKKKP